MAITVKEEPQAYQSVYNEMVLLLTSNKRHLPKFNYIVEISIDGTYSSRLRVAPRPDQLGMVNISKHIEGYISGDLDLPDTNVFKLIPNSFVKYSVAFKEEYVNTMTFTSVSNSSGYAKIHFGSTPPFIVGDILTIGTGGGGGSYDGEHEVTIIDSATTVILDVPFIATEVGTAVLTSGATSIMDDVATVTEKFAYNSVIDWIDYNSFDSTVYIPDSASPCPFLTNLDNNHTVLLDDRINFNIYNEDDNEAMYLLVTSATGQLRITNNFVDSTNASMFLSIGVAPDDILNHTGSLQTVVSGVAALIDSNTTSYTVQLQNATFQTTSEVFTFKVKSKCTPYENYKLIYLNKSGSYSTFNFELGSKEKFNATKKNFKANYGSVTTVGENDSFGWNSFDRGSSTYATSVSNTYQITSDYMTESDGNKIKDLIHSPDVYHLSNDGILRAINVLDTSVSVKTRLIDKLINYSIAFTYATKNSTQR